MPESIKINLFQLFSSSPLSSTFDLCFIYFSFFLSHFMVANFFREIFSMTKNNFLHKIEEIEAKKILKSNK
jgi:hypothetical protein